MNILIVTESFPPHAGGSGWSTYYLCMALKEKGHKVLVAKINGKENEYGGIKVIPVKNKKIIKKIIEKEDIDVLHSQHMTSTKLASGLGIPLVVTLRDYWPLCYDGNMFDYMKNKNVDKAGYSYDLKNIFTQNGLFIKIFSPFIAFYMLFRTRNALKNLRKADKIICVSEFVKKKIELSADKEKIVVISNMVDFKKLSKIKPKKFDKKTIVFVGKLNSSKGPQVLVDAVIGIRGIKLVFIGEGPLRKKLAEKCKKNHVECEFMSYLDNDKVLGCIKGAEIFVVPSLWHEPLGRTLLEGLSVGAKIIATSTGGTPEIIKDGYNGLLFDGSAKELGQKIRVLLKDKKIQKRVSENSMKTAKERFNTDQLIDEFERVYLALVRGSSKKDF